MRSILMLLSLADLAQSQPLRLTTPNATLAEEFSSIRGVRELANGRLLVSDYQDERVVLVDFAARSVVPRVTSGSGPREARLPTRLIPFRGDSTLLVDLGNNRLLLLDGNGNPARSIPGDRTGILGTRGMDPTGAFYFAIPAWSERQPLPNDSVRVVRWNPRTQREDPVSVIQGERMRSDIREPARTPRIPIVGYASSDGWTVDDQGQVRIVRAGGYRIETRAPGIPVLLGPGYAYATREVTPADRVAFVRRFLTESPMSGKGPNGGLGFSPAPTEAEVAALLPGTQVAERHAMFNPGEVLAAPGGRLWVGRPAEEAKAVWYDVFDPTGRRIGQIELRPGRRVMAVGRAGVYVVAEAESGIQFLERYPLPSLGPNR